MALSLEAGRDPFADVQARGSVDYMLRTTQQQLTDLSGQADLKASIVMTTSAILTSVAAARLGHESVRWSLVTFMVGLLAAMLCAVFSLIPTFRTRLPEGQAPNPLFFGHFGAMGRDQYLDAMADLMQRDADVYRTMVLDMHAAGRYLLQHKYRYLRLSYMFFLGAFAIAGVQQLTRPSSISPMSTEDVLAHGNGVSELSLKTPSTPSSWKSLEPAGNVAGRQAVGTAVAAFVGLYPGKP